MKRYRVLGYDIDSRASLLSIEIKETWAPDVKEMHRRNQEAIGQELMREFGEENALTKLDNFMALGNAPFSVVSFHNKFLRQVRTAFVMGAYYPALTGACALGERVLNHLLLGLRESYKHTPQYKRVFRKDSFDDWPFVIDILDAWGVLIPEASNAYRKLAKLRNQSIHFKPDLDHNDRELALEAIQTLSRVIDAQFTAFGVRPWFIPGTPGVSFIKKEAERVPIVKLVYLPNCAPVGPLHTLEPRIDSGVTHWIVHDDYAYEAREITDDEFAEIATRNNR
jgi:hypothetical protein